SRAPLRVAAKRVSFLATFLFRRLLLGVGERTDADVADGPGRVIRADAERPRWLALEADGELLAGGIDVDHLFLLDPGLDAVFRPLNADAIPAVALELVNGAGFVLRGVEAVDAGQPDGLAAPAADDQGAVRVADGEGGGAEEVAAGQAPGLQGDLVVHLGEI